MALEMEVKYTGADHGAVRKALSACGAEMVGVWFESNAVFDNPDRSLKGAGKLLRLRRRGDASVLTVKVPPEGEVPEGLKVFDEHETLVADHDAMADCLEALGYAVVFAYEKVREKWRLNDCAVCLDTLPFGMYVEIEGTRDGIAACVKQLGLAEENACTETYYSLNLCYRTERDLPEDESFVFEEAERKRILKELQSC